MKIILNIVLIKIVALSALGQLPGFRTTDSLHQQLAVVKQDTTRVLILAELAEAFRNTMSDSAMRYGQQSLSLAKQIQFPKGEAKALLSMSVILREMGNFPKSLEAGLKALQISEQHHFVAAEQLSLIRIANVYSSSKDFTAALNYYRAAEKKLKLAPDGYLIAAVQVFIGDIYGELNQFDSSLYYERQASHKVFLYPSILPIYFRVLGNIETKSGNNQLALKYFDQGLQSALLEYDYRKAASVYISMASLYNALNQIDSAIYNANLALVYGQKLAYKNQIMEAATLLAELYEKRDIKQSLRYYKIANAAKDSMYGIEKVQAIQTITLNVQEHQRELEKAKTAYRNKVRQYALIAGLAIFSLIAFILYRNNKQKQKANKVLKTTLSDLKSAQSLLIHSEKMASLGELTAGIAHEIQNPLNFVNNFSEVNKEMIAELKEEIHKGNYSEVKLIADDIEVNQEKINHHGKRAEAIVSGMLQHSRMTPGQRELTDINALCDEYLRLASHGLRAKDKSFNVKLETNFDNSISKINVVPQDIGRVILNLINNAFYAVNEKAKLQSASSLFEPLVAVSTNKLNDKIEIKIKDNGSGIPEKIVSKIFQPFFTTKPTGQGTGLGLSLAYDIAKAHGGEIKVETKEGEGSEFVIQLPA